MSIYSQALAAWEAARAVCSDSVTVTPAGSPEYNPETGTAASTGTAVIVNAIVCPMSAEERMRVDPRMEMADKVVQVKVADLAAIPRPGDSITIDSQIYEVSLVTPFAFGVAECALKGVR